MDPFSVFALAPSIDIDGGTLESRYLELSRTCHPDHHATADAAAKVALLSRAASVNEAYRVLRDRWRRAEALIQLRAPSALGDGKALSPAFLLAALELAEEVAHVQRGTEAASALRARLERAVDADWQAVRAAVESAQWQAAATHLHESRYHRKALHDLTR